MTNLLTAGQMRALEQAGMDDGLTGAMLMERAAGCIVASVEELWPELEAGDHAVVLCGPGNNGGDGYAVARMLAGQGWRVEVFGMGDPAKMSADSAGTRRLWETLGPVGNLADAGRGSGPDIVVDAVFGTGLSRAIPAEVVTALAAARDRDPARPARIVAVDAPSGLDCDTGRMLMPEGNEPVAADLTVTFEAAKHGHYLGAGPSVCGRLRVGEIGLAPWRGERPGPADAPMSGLLRLVNPDAELWHALLPQTAGSAHKYQRGHALVLSGGVGRGGAARMAARAALRAGAGLVTLGCPPAALIENAAQLDAVMLRPVADPEALAEMLEDDRLSAICMGPGLGTGERTRGLVRAALAARRRTVLDADALSVFSEAPDDLFAELHEDCVLTPHEGEFARLFPDLSSSEREKAGRSKVDDACAAADRAGCSVLLKGPDTVIASPGGRAALHASAYGREARWLGTAGAGDVLSGLIAGLMAPPGDTPVQVRAEAAAWLHVEAALHVGPGLIAEDLPEALPAVYRALGL